MKRILLSTLLLSSVLFADDDYFSFFSKKAGVKPVDNQLYLKECGSCHFAFQAGLLPKRSWEKMMRTLDNHFDTDASLDSMDQQQILNYLVKNASDESMNYKRSAKITRSLYKDEAPLSVTEVPYFIRKHREIPRRIIEQKEVKTLSNCTACHTTAEKGVYSERAIRIPNYGRWDD